MFHLLLLVSAASAVRFVQITDLHFSVWDRSSHDDAMLWCRRTLPSLNASVVIVTGDVTHGEKYLSAFGSTSFAAERRMRDEWRSACAGNWTWLEVPGNHDTFAQRVDGPAATVHVEDGVTFAALDLTVRYGAVKMLNFYGEFRTVHERALDGAAVVAAHYPIAYVTGGMRLRNVTYLCGHLHVPNAVVERSDSVTEIELGDWKKKRHYRIGTVSADGRFEYEDRDWRTDETVPPGYNIIMHLGCGWVAVLSHAVNAACLVAAWKIRRFGILAATMALPTFVTWTDEGVLVLVHSAGLIVEGTGRMNITVLYCAAANASRALLLRFKRSFVLDCLLALVVSAEFGVAAAIQYAAVSVVCFLI